MKGKVFVEFVGTMFLSFVIFATGNYLAIGAALAIAVLLGGPVSNGAFNPAIAIAMYSAGKIPNTDLIPYLIGEILGGLAGLALFQTFVK
jgi:aquaporin Z